MVKIKLESTIDEIQKEFACKYPYLKIEFYKEGGSVKKKLLAGNMQVGTLVLAEVVSAGYELIMDINAHRTIIEVNNDFSRCLNVSIVIFRKCGNLWIETSLTDDWTLGRQNNEAELLYQPLSE